MVRHLTIERNDTNMDNVINMGEFIGAAPGDKRHMLGKFLYFSLSNLLVEKEELYALCESMGIA